MNIPLWRGQQYTLQCAVCRKLLLLKIEEEAGSAEQQWEEISLVSLEANGQWYEFYKLNCKFVFHFISQQTNPEAVYMDITEHRANVASM